MNTKRRMHIVVTIIVEKKNFSTLVAHKSKRLFMIRETMYFKVHD